MTDPRWQTVREQLLCEVDQGWDGGDANAALDSLEGKMEWLRSRDKMRDKEIEQLREALRSGQWADLSGGNEVLMIDAKIARAALGGEE